MTTDNEQIDRLHETDVRASRSRDFATLRTLMSDDAVVLPPGGRMIRGADALDRSFAAMRSAPVTTEVLDYRFDWREITVCGEHAFEWGYILGRERNRATGAEVTSRHHVVRILQRQPDASWRVHRTIWNTAAPEG